MSEAAHQSSLQMKAGEYKEVLCAREKPLTNPYPWQAGRRAGPALTSCSTRKCRLRILPGSTGEIAVVMWVRMSWPPGCKDRKASPAPYLGSMGELALVCRHGRVSRLNNSATK